MLTFIPSVQNRGRKLVEKLKPGIWRNKSVTKIGIHVRRSGAFVSASATGYSAAPTQYFHRAMGFMKQKFRNVLFIVASDNIPWAQNNLGNDSTVYSTGLSAGEDMALLASCDHVIASSGSFSWWAAWLANGTTVYY